MRKTLLFAILAGTLGFVVFDSARDERSSRASSTPSSRAPDADATEVGTSPVRTGGNSVPLALPERSRLAEQRTGLFTSDSWQRPAHKIAAVPPPAPTAPPLPYKYAGKLVDGDRVSLLLAKGDTVFPIREGQTLDGAYRVESISETRITLVYLPLGSSESLSVVSALSVAAYGARPDPAAARGRQTVSSAEARPRNGSDTGMSSPPAAAAGSPTLEVAPRAQTKPASLFWEGPQQVKLGSRFEVALKVTSGQPLQASPMQLRFDPAYLEFLAARPGKFFGGGNGNFSYRASPDGSIFVGATSQNPTPAADAELLIFTFRSVKPALAAELSVSSLNLQGPAGRPIAFGQLGAFKTVIAP